MDLNITNTPKEVKKSFLINTGIPLVLLLGTIALAIFIVYPKYNEIPVKKDTADKLTQQDQRLQVKINKLNDLVDFKEIVNEDLKLVNTALPSTDDIPLLLTEIQQISKGAGLDITNLTYAASTADKSGKANKVYVQLSANGNFNQTKVFISNLEKASRIIDISTLRFSSSETAQKTDLETSEVQITLGLISPYLFVESKAVTEDPITIDVRDKGFLTFINKLKGFTTYETVVDTTNIGKENPFR